MPAAIMPQCAIDKLDTVTAVVILERNNVWYFTKYLDNVMFNGP